MHTNNPYAHAGWPNPNPYAVGRGSGGGGTPPSIFGALPFGSQSSPSAMVPFRFVSLNPDILNCAVMGPDNAVYYRIATDNPHPGFTVLQSSQSQGQAVGVIEWKQHPLVELRGVVAKQYVSQWLPLAQQHTSRWMEVKGKRYSWVPGDNIINLFSMESNPASLIGKVVRYQGSITLEISAHAIQAGLLDSCVLAAVLLLCGRKLD